MVFPRNEKNVLAADALQGLPFLQYISLDDNPTKDLAAFRVIELLRLIPMLVDVELNVAAISDSTAQDVLEELKRDPLRCIYLRRACQERVEDCGGATKG